MVLPDCEGVIIKLKGGSSQDLPDGLPCSTDTLDHPDSIDFGDGGIATFGARIGDERAMLRDCFQATISSFVSSFSSSQAPFNGLLVEGSLEWVGEHGWQPLDVCIDWQEDNLGGLDNFDVEDNLGGVENSDSIAMRCNLVPSGEGYWHLEGCLNLDTACALS